MKNIPCLKDIESKFQCELYALEYDYFRENGFYIELYMFPQIWGSTALGFSGVGGQAMTSAYTVVANDVNSGYFGVYFGGRLAYIIKNPNDLFYEDLRYMEMKSFADKGEYLLPNCKVKL